MQTPRLNHVLASRLRHDAPSCSPWRLAFVLGSVLMTNTILREMLVQKGVPNPVSSTDESSDSVPAVGVQMMWLLLSRTLEFGWDTAAACPKMNCLSLCSRINLAFTTPK
jgi:hypothetical protein